CRESELRTKRGTAGRNQAHRSTTQTKEQKDKNEPSKRKSHKKQVRVSEKMAIETELKEDKRAHGNEDGKESKSEVKEKSDEIKLKPRGRPKKPAYDEVERFLDE